MTSKTVSPPPKAQDNTITYGALCDRIDSFATGLQTAGLQPGDRVALLIPMSLDLYALTLGIMAAGMTVVLVDPGMGIRRILGALVDAKVRAVVSTAQLMRHRFWLPHLWGRKLFSVDSSGLALRSVAALLGPTGVNPEQQSVKTSPAPGRALLTFTSGTTGRPKGVDRLHSILIAQHLALREHFPESPDEIDMPCFPVVALHNLCCGITTVMPDVDLSAPGQMQASKVTAQVLRYSVTSISGAPAYMARWVDSLIRENTALPTVRRVGVGGGPVTPSLAARTRKAFPTADAQVIYGSSEAEPIASISVDAVADDVAGVNRHGRGYLVGAAADMIDVLLVRLPSNGGGQPLHVEKFAVAPGEEGEIIVRGDHVTGRYFNHPRADRAHKVASTDGSLWHRTGDLGTFDEAHRLRLTGRLGDQINLHGVLTSPFPIEQAIESISGIARAALVAANPEALPCLFVVEEALKSTDAPKSGAAAAGVHPGAVWRPAVDAIIDAPSDEQIRVHIVATLPTDRRHNTKIDRGALRAKL